MDTTFATPATAATITSATSAPTTSAATPGATTAPRVDIYRAIHQALRSFMSDTLIRLGRMDADDAADSGAALAQLDALLTLCASHIGHENDFLHAAIDARRPDGAARTAGDHVEHLEAIDDLRAEALALQMAPPEARAMRARRLYQHLALFVAENFQHMHVEETANNAALWALYSDAELMALHGRILASIGPDESLLVARWMLPALAPAEAAMVAGGMKTQMPPECLLSVLQHVRPHLADPAWNRIARAAGVAQQPGLVDFA